MSAPIPPLTGGIPFVKTEKCGICCMMGRKGRRRKRCVGTVTTKGERHVAKLCLHLLFIDNVFLCLLCTNQLCKLLRTGAGPPQETVGVGCN